MRFLEQIVYLEGGNDKTRCFRQLQRVSCPVPWSQFTRSSSPVVL